VEAGYIEDPADLYRLTKEELLTLEGFADKKADNLLASIESSKERPLAHSLAALGIRGVGRTVAETLVAAFPSLDTLAQVSEEALAEVEGIGPITAGNIGAWFERPRNRQMVEKLREAGVHLEAEQRTTPTPAGPLTGMTFVITGTLTRPRSEVQAWIEAQGGRVTGSVSGKTNYLLIGEAPGGSKFRKAQQLEVPMITEEELTALVEE
jgi:DNA ligase (NAD+)